MAAPSPWTDALVITNVRAKGVSASDISDDDLGTIIADALRYWSQMRPKLKLTTSSTCITTVADQPNYSKPTDAHWIVEVAWNPDYDEDFDDIYMDTLAATLDIAESSNLFIHYRNVAQLHKFFGGHWKEIDDEIYLIPTPNTSGEKVAVYYADDKTIADLDQINDYLFAELVHGMCLEAMATAKINSVGWSAGAYRVDKGVVEQTMRLAATKLANVRNQIANSYTASRN
jgi:hypothetical protein